MTDNTILTERRGHVLIVTINRPEARNAVNAAVSTAVGDALQAAEKAYALAPEDARVLDTLGWVLCKQGRTSEGTDVLEQAKAIDADISEIDEHLEQCSAVAMFHVEPLAT